ncbi:MAG: response regulator, partial [Deltaproteobacteria bacterium]|nr:response regulator [Deltaproteobacteria bacterium]
MNDKTIRLLLVEDDKVDQMAFERHVKNKELPYDYTIAGSVAEAREILKSTSFDVIISDYRLGDGTSFELFDLFKDLPVIVTTGTGTEDIAVEAMKLGAYDYLIKDPEGNYLKTLPLTVELALKRKQTEKELLKHQENLEFMVKERTAQLEAEIVERNKTEQQLKNSEKFLAAVIENIPDMIFVKDAKDLSFIRFNKAGEDLLGYSKEELIGKNYYDFFSEHEADAFIRKDRDVLNSKQLLDIPEEIIQTKFRGERVLHTKKISIQDENGQPVYLLGISEDITDKKKAEDSKKELEEQLRQAQKMEAIGVLAGGVAHDFNNILTTIIGNANLALMEVGKDDALREEIEDIKIAGERAAALTRQLLAFSRKQIIQPKILDLNELLSGTEKMLGRLLGEDVEILTIFEPALWQVEADPGQMEQVIMNLAVNARDAMPMGGKLTIETANVDLDKNYLSEHGIEGTPGHYVMLAISDTGSGMDKETQEHIFEPFFTTKELGKGTGLGLSTVYGIAKQNKGFIWVYSEPGQGTTFKIYLPKVKEGAEAEEKEQTPVLELGGSETVLIVEDDDGLRKIAETVLKQRGYKVLKAENGEDALRVSEAHDGSIDLLITDVVMPKMGGRETAERLQPLYTQIKVIYMSGYTDNAIVRHGVLEPGLNFL